MRITGFYVHKSGRVTDSRDIENTIVKAGVGLLALNASMGVAEAGPIADRAQPLIDIFKDLAEPVSYGFMIKGFMKIMAGEEHEGTKTIKNSIGGFIGIQWIPMIYDAIRDIRF